MCSTHPGKLDSDRALLPLSQYALFAKAKRNCLTPRGSDLGPEWTGQQQKALNNWVETVDETVSLSESVWEFEEENPVEGCAQKYDGRRCASESVHQTSNPPCCLGRPPAGADRYSGWMTGSASGNDMARSGLLGAFRIIMGTAYGQQWFTKGFANRAEDGGHVLSHQQEQDRGNGGTHVYIKILPACVPWYLKSDIAR